MVDMQHFSQQILPMYPILHYHDWDRYLRKKDPQQTKLFDLSVDFVHNESECYLNQNSALDPLHNDFQI